MKKIVIGLMLSVIIISAFYINNDAKVKKDLADKEFIDFILCSGHTIDLIKEAKSHHKKSIWTYCVLPENEIKTLIRAGCKVVVKNNRMKISWE